MHVASNISIKICVARISRLGEGDVTHPVDRSLAVLSCRCMAFGMFTLSELQIRLDSRFPSSP